MMKQTETPTRDSWNSGPIRRVLARFIARPEQSTAGLVIGTLAVGAIFYHLVEGWNLLDSVYFCVITLTTIGYGDYAPKTDVGKLFTIFYAFAGIGLLATYIQLRAQKRIEHKGIVSAIKHEADALHEEVLPHDSLA